MVERAFPRPRAVSAPSDPGCSWVGVPGLLPPSCGGLSRLRFYSRRPVAVLTLSTLGGPASDPRYPMFLANTLMLAAVTACMAVIAAGVHANFASAGVRSLPAAPVSPAWGMRFPER